jgi:outer membrane protein OmpA-like peptidoglycan-associated protein
VTLRVTPSSGAPVVVRKRVAVGLRRPRRPLTITIPSQVFDFGQSRLRLRRASARYLLRVARILRRARSVTVGSYTDNVGPSAFNRRLTLARARAVRAFLVRRGRVPASVLLVRGYGETGRFGDNRTDAGKQRNRRLVLRVRFPRRLARISAL